MWNLITATQWELYLTGQCPEPQGTSLIACLIFDWSVKLSSFSFVLWRDIYLVLFSLEDWLLALDSPNIPFSLQLSGKCLISRLVHAGVTGLVNLHLDPSTHLHPFLSLSFYRERFSLGQQASDLWWSRSFLIKKELTSFWGLGCETVNQLARSDRFWLGLCEQWSFLKFTF